MTDDELREALWRLFTGYLETLDRADAPDDPELRERCKAELKARCADGEWYPVEFLSLLMRDWFLADAETVEKTAGIGAVVDAITWLNEEMGQGIQ